MGRQKRRQQQQAGRTTGDRRSSRGKKNNKSGGGIEQRATARSGRGARAIEWGDKEGMTLDLEKQVRVCVSGRGNGGRAGPIIDWNTSGPLPPFFSP